MSLSELPSQFPLLAETELREWGAVPTAVISDELNCAGVLSAAIRPLSAGMRFAGQALTIRTSRVDDGAPRRALARVWPGAVIVMDARVHPDTAVWGGNLIAVAKARGAAAVVVDGNVRDLVDLRRSGLAVFARGATPAGLVWGGTVDGPIECGGVEIMPGDIVVGDDDGVIVVPLKDRTGLLEQCRRRLRSEADSRTGQQENGQ